jgi:hypothetical protein
LRPRRSGHRDRRVRRRRRRRCVRNRTRLDLGHEHRANVVVERILHARNFGEHDGRNLQLGGTVDELVVHGDVRELHFGKHELRELFATDEFFFEHE